MRRHITATCLSCEKEHPVRHTLNAMAAEFEELAFDDTTATESALWQTAVEHLRAAASCVKALEES